jgi:hypothetical protein
MVAYLFRYDWKHRSHGACVKTIGSRRQAPITERASGESLAEGARFNESLAHLANTTFIPKGVYRFRTHEASNKHQQDCLARGMGMFVQYAVHGRLRLTCEIARHGRRVRSLRRPQQPVENVSVVIAPFVLERTR